MVRLAKRMMATMLLPAVALCVGVRDEDFALDGARRDVDKEDGWE